MPARKIEKAFIRLISLCIYIFFFIPLLYAAEQAYIKKDFKVNLKAENITLTEVARSLNEMGIDVYIDRAEKDRVVNCEFKDTPIEKAIKMLTYPLNYAIVFNERGEIKQLRIFNTNISPAKGYIVFQSKNNDKNNDDNVKSNTYTSANTSLTSSSFQEIKINEKEKKTALNADRDLNPLVLEAAPLNGETAYAYNIWLNKRLAEMNNITEQQKMYAVRELETTKPNLTQNMNLMAKTNMELMMAQQTAPQTMTGDGTQKDTKGIEAFYNYTNEFNKIMETKRSQEIVNTQMKNLASYMYYQQKSQTGTMTNPYAAYQSYYNNMAIIKNLYGKK